MKIKYYLLMLVTMVALSSCNKNEEIPLLADNKESVTFKIAPEDAQTRTNGVTRYVMEVYDENGETPVNCFGNNKTNRMEVETGEFKIDIDRELSYVILFWADDSDTYDITELSSVKLKSGKNMTEHAYFKKFEGKIAESQNIGLKRVVAKITYHQDGGYFNKEDQAITITYDKDYSFNCFTNTITEIPSEGIEEVGRTFSMSSKKLHNDLQLGVDYHFAMATDNTLNITIGVESEMCAPKEVSNISYIASRRTIIKGQFSTNSVSQDFNMEIDDVWGVELETEFATVKKTKGENIVLPENTTSGSMTITGDALEVGDYPIIKTYPLLKNLDISETSTTTILTGAFKDFTDLESIKLPTGLTTIESKAFYSCLKLNKIDLPNNLKEIGDEAFLGCELLVNIKLPGSLKTVGSLILNGTGVTSLDIPSSITTWGNESFAYCDNLTTITITAGLRTIGVGAFARNEKLTDVTIPNSITALPNNIFEKCASLSHITLPNEIETIGEKAFSGCSKLSSVKFPNKLKRIEPSAFFFTGLVNIELPVDLVYIGISAFQYCGSFNIVTLYATSPPFLGNNAFHGNGDIRKFYVPENSVQAYKNAQKWSDYVDDIMFKPVEPEPEPASKP